MPGPAILTLVATAALVAVVAGYLIRVALVLRHVVLRLNTILTAVAAVGEQAAPIGEVANAINADLDSGRGALEGVTRRAAEAAERTAAEQAPAAQAAGRFEPM